MSAYNTTLLDEDNNEIYPKTLAENVYDGNVRMDQKVDGIRTDLGNPSSASAVTGADAFSKISKLNSELSNKSKVTERVESVTATPSNTGEIVTSLAYTTGVVGAYVTPTGSALYCRLRKATTGVVVVQVLNADSTPYTSSCTVNIVYHDVT